MNDLGTIARQSALHCEAKKHAYRQTQDGVVISFVLHPQEVPDGLATAALGTRYQLVVVELNDDETPTERKVLPDTTGPEQSVSANKTAPAIALVPRTERSRAHPKQAWGDMAPSQQAGILCSDPSFWKFLQTWGVDAYDDDSAADYVRDYCGVKSRSKIVDGDVCWLRLVGYYRAWQREPEHVA